MRQQIFRTFSHVLALGFLSGCMISPAQAQTYHFTDLGTPGFFSQANGVNNSGQVIGYTSMPDGTTQAVVCLNGAMTELGTLGGANSYGQAINDNGQIVGFSDTQNFEQDAFLWQNGAMTDLGTLGGIGSQATAINNHGQVAGWAGINTSFGIHAFLWDGGMHDLGDLGGGSSQAYGINDNEQVVGYSTNASGNYHAFLWDPIHGMQDLGTLAGYPYSYAYAINDAGQVVGCVDDGNGDTHAFVWQNGAMTDLGTLGGFASCALGINASGQIIGYSFTPDCYLHTCFWQNGSPIDIGVITGGAFSQGNGINNAGLVVGYGDTAAGDVHAFSVPVGDTSPPITTASLAGPVGSNGWYTGAVTVTLSATDQDGASDVAATYYTVDGGAQQTYSNSFTVSQYAIHSITFWSRDKAGNIETANAQTIKIDGTPPSVSAASNPSTLSPPTGKMVNVTITGSMSDALSGLNPAGASFSVVDDYGTVQPSGSITVQSNGSYSFTIQLQASRNGNDKNGRHYTITVRGTDMAGNVGTAVTVVTVPHN